MNNGVVLGYDMTTALAIAGALGLNTYAVADLLPIIEGAMVRKSIEAREGTNG